MFRYRKHYNNLNTVIRQIFENEPIKISDSTQINTLLKDHNCTLFKPSEDSSSISTNLKFSSFSNAICFMNNVAIVADMVDHHPDWSNVYNQIAVKLNTHTVQGISEKDIYMAKAIEKIYDLINQKEREYTDIVVKDFEKAFD